MDNIEIVEKVLDVHGCQDAAAIARDAKRIFNYDITNQSAGAAARKLVSIGKAGSSRDGFGRTIYWLTRKGTYKWDKWRN